MPGSQTGQSLRALRYLVPHRTNDVIRAAQRGWKGAWRKAGGGERTEAASDGGHWQRRRAAGPHLSAMYSMRVAGAATMLLGE